MNRQVYVVMVPGWDEGEEICAASAYTNEAAANIAAKKHPRGCAFVVEVPLYFEEKEKVTR